MSEPVLEHSGAVLRLMGDQASYADLRSIIDVVMGSGEFRSRCDLLSCLLGEEEKERRQELCRHTVVVMLSDCQPAEPGDVLVQGHPTTPVFVQTCVPPPHGPWKSHIQANYRLVSSGSRGRRMKMEAEFAMISPYLFERVWAVESLWGVSGHLLNK